MQPFTTSLNSSCCALAQFKQLVQVFNAKNNFGGIIGLATEIVAKKVSSEEEKYSDHSWLIFYNNYKGIYSQVCFDNAVCTLTRPTVTSADPGAAFSIELCASSASFDMSGENLPGPVHFCLHNSAYPGYLQTQDRLFTQHTMMCETIYAAKHASFAQPVCCHALHKGEHVCVFASHRWYI